MKIIKTKDKWKYQIEEKTQTTYFWALKLKI